MSRMRGMGIKAAKGDVFGYNNETACVCVCVREMDTYS